MTNFFRRLTERAFGVALTIQPMVAPLYTSEAYQVEEGMLEMLADETQEIPSQPEIAMKSLYKSVQIDNTPVEALSLPIHAPLVRAGETHTILKHYPVIQRDVQPHVSTMEQHTTSTTTQGIHENDRTHTTSHSTLQNTLQQVSYTTSEEQHEHLETHLASLSINTDQRVVSKEQPLDKSKKSETHIPVLPPPISTLQEPVARKVSRDRSPIMRQREQHVEVLEVEQPVPTIQVTIGRIEVRATTTPTPNAQPQQQQVVPPVMSLDDYLKQRAKGGR